MKFLNSLIPIFPDISENISQELLNITLFGELAGRTEEIIEGFRGYQVFVQRFLSPLTPYRELLIKHSMGSGKTCTAFLVILAYKQSVMGSVQNTILLANNKSQLKNIRSLLKKCITFLPSEEYEKRILDKYIEKNVKYMTFDSINKINRRDILQNVKVIIVDEAHIIHHKTAEGSLYKNMMTLFDKAREKRIRLVLMTGTPITNHFSKLFQLMDLLLPSNLRFEEYEKKKLGVSYDMDDEVEDYEKENKINGVYFDEGGLKKEAEKEISRRLYGRVSSFQIMKRETKLIEMGQYYDYTLKRGTDEKSDTTSNTKVFIDEMIGEQKKEYINCIDGTKQESTEISLSFYAPQLKSSDYSIRNQNIILSEKVKNTISDNESLKNHSILYYNILKEMGEFDEFQERKKEAVFYFNDLVRGSANMLFSAILSKYNFEHLVTNDDISKLLTNLKKGKAVKKKRFVVVSSSFGITNENEIDKVIQIYSHPDNRYGEYLRLIIGSRKIALGYNLINGRQVHIVLQWNSPLMNQAIFRVVRGKTNFLDESDNYVRVYRHFITPGNRKDVLFERRLIRVEKKESLNAKVMSLLDRVSVDCFVNRAYHTSNPELDFTSDCNFLKCSQNYDCGKLDVPIVNVDNTFLFFEDENKTKKLQTIISELAKSNVISISVSDLKSCVSFTENEFYFYLLKIITEQYIFEDALGFLKIIGCIGDVVFFKSKPFLNDELEAISHITDPSDVFYDYSPVCVDIFYACNTEKDKIINLFRLEDMVQLEEAYNELNILCKVWVFEYLFPLKSRYKHILVEFLKLKERNNFLELNEEGIGMVHKLISDFHIKEHKVKKPEDIIEGLRTFFLSDNKWKDSVMSVSLALAVSKRLIDKEETIPTTEDHSVLDFSFEKDEKGNIKRKTKTDKNRKGRNCKTLRRSDLDAYFEKYLSVLTEDYERYKRNIKGFFQKYTQEVSDYSLTNVAAVLRRLYNNEKSIDGTCDFLYKMQELFV